MQAFITDCNVRLRQLCDTDPSVFGVAATDDYNTVVRAVVRRRLGMLVPYVDTWPQAIAVLVKQQSPVTAVTLLLETATGRLQSQ